MSASNTGSGSRRLLPTGSSLDQQKQQQQQLQQQAAIRRASASNFDQATSQLLSQYNQQQIAGQSASAASSTSYLATGDKKPPLPAPVQAAPLGKGQEDQFGCYYYNQQQQQRQKHNLADNNEAPLIGKAQLLQQQQASAARAAPSATQKNGAYNQAHSSGARYSSSNNPATCSSSLQSQLQLGQTSAPSQPQQDSANPISAKSGAKDEVDVMFNRLMALEAFRKLHPSVIRNLCSYAFIERIDKGVIVFRQGDDAINWYALLDGSVDVKVAQSGGQKDGVTLCTLGVGTTFGASVMPGKSHSVSVVTSDDCTLLRVRRADFQEIFNEQSHLINNVESSPFCSFTSLNRLSASNNSVSKRSLLSKARRRKERQERQEQQQQQQQQQQQFQSLNSRQANPADGQGRQRQSALRAEPEAAAAGTARDEEEEEDEDEEELDDLNLDSVDANELSSHLMRIGWVLRTLMLRQCPQLIQNRRIHPQLHLFSLHQRRSTLLPHQQQSAIKGAQRGGQQHQLLSAASSSQLVPAVVSKSAGRKVANYVASSLMRAGGASKQQAAAAKAQREAAGSGGQHQPAAGLFTSNSFDSTAAHFGGAPTASGQQQQHHAHHQAARVSSLASTSSASSSSSCGHHQSQAASGREEPVMFSRSMLGKEMVDWLLQVGQSNTNAARFVSSRLQAVSMWQVLLEQGIVFAFSSEQESAGSGSEPQLAASSGGQSASQFQFCDHQQAYYKFWFDRDGTKQDSRQGGSGAATLSGGNANNSNNIIAANSNSQNVTNNNLPSRPSDAELDLANESLWWSLKVLSKLAPDACFRLILGKQPHERSQEEVDIVYEELQHLKALGHLTNSVKKELAACVTSEHHAKQNTVIFNQGDPGHSWYIILRGSVNVVIVGKGVVCTLHDGDDFGKLALVNDAPRAATIVTNEPNCYFLRVDKLNFNTILRDVEANTVRLKEHGKEVLILQKVAAVDPTALQNEPPMTGSSTALQPQSQQQQHQQQQQQQHPTGSTMALPGQPEVQAGAFQQGANSAAATAASGASSAPTASQLQQQQTVGGALKYMVMAGTSEKMLEHLLETRIDGHTQIGPLLTGKSGLMQHDQVSSYIQCQGDNFLEDFILTHNIFMPTANLCQELLKQYQCHTKSQLANSSNNNGDANNGGLHPANCAAASVSGPAEHAKLDDEYLVAKKRRVVKFIRCWMLITREHFFQQQQIQSFLTSLHQKVKQDAARFCSLQPELKAVARILELHLEEDLESRHKGVQRWIEDVYGNMLPIRRLSGAWEPSGKEEQLFLGSLQQRRFEHKLSTIQAEDELVFRVYCADHSFVILRQRFDEKAGEIKQLAARRLCLADHKDLILVHVKSNGERIIYNDLDSNISTSLSVNGRIFVCPLDHIDAISPIPEQDPFQEVYQTTLGAPCNNTISVAPQSATLGDMATTTTSSSAAAATNSSPANNSCANNANDRQLLLLAQQHQQLQQPQTASNMAHNSLSGSATTNTKEPANQVGLQASDLQGQAGGQPISSHLLASTPTSYADIKTQMSLSVGKLEEFSSRDVAYCLSQLGWSLLKNMHEFELIYTVFGRHNFKQITANLNVFLRHFNEIQYWVVTQICLSSSLSKRVQILRKFIKIAAHCKELQNLNAFFAIIMGLSNMAVARLTQTWEKLPSKLKRTFSQFESLIDPSRNHRRYRIFISKMEPPIIPFMPLFLKDMTFAHEGNKTYLENGLINFEKMQMVAQTLRTIRYCKSRPMKLDSSACKFKGSIRSIELFFRDLKIIDNQRTLTQMSHQLEHRKT